MEMDPMDLQRQHIFSRSALFMKNEIRPDKSYPHYPHPDSETLRQMSSTSWKEDFRGLLAATSVE
jgi:hypothetical protein